MNGPYRWPQLPQIGWVQVKIALLATAVRTNPASTIHGQDNLCGMVFLSGEIHVNEVFCRAGTVALPRHGISRWGMSVMGY